MDASVRSILILLISVPIDRLTRSNTDSFSNLYGNNLLTTLRNPTAAEESTEEQYQLPSHEIIPQDHRPA